MVITKESMLTMIMDKSTSVLIQERILNLEICAKESMELWTKGNRWKSNGTLKIKKMYRKRKEVMFSRCIYPKHSKIKMKCFPVQSCQRSLTLSITRTSRMETSK
jgi:hypothetical protein